MCLFRTLHLAGKKYNFRVKAINKEGESIPLETTTPTLAKNPFAEPSQPGRPTFADWDNTSVELKWDPVSTRILFCSLAGN